MDKQKQILELHLRQQENPSANAVIQVGCYYLCLVFHAFIKLSSVHDFRHERILICEQACRWENKQMAGMPL